MSKSNGYGGMNPPGITGWPVLLGDGSEQIIGARGRVDRENGKVEHTVDIRPHRGWFQWRERPARPKRQPGDGSRLIATAMFLLFVLAGGLLGVSYAAQFVMIVRERHGQILASNVEALSSDVALMIFSLLALGLARKGLNAIVARWGVILMACLSASMNLAAATDGDWRSVLTYCGPSILLAFVVDTTVSVIKKHYLGMRSEPSPFMQLARVLVKAGGFLGLIVLYGLRLLLAPIETPKGLRRMVLNATPLPAAPVVIVTWCTISRRRSRGASATRRTGPQRSRAAGVARAATARQPSSWPPSRPSTARWPVPARPRQPGLCRACTQVGMDAGWARTVLRKAVLAAYAANHRSRRRAAPGPGGGQVMNTINWHATFELVLVAVFLLARVGGYLWVAIRPQTAAPEQVSASELAAAFQDAPRSRAGHASRALAALVEDLHLPQVAPVSPRPSSGSAVPAPGSALGLHRPGTVASRSADSGRASRADSVSAPEGQDRASGQDSASLPGAGRQHDGEG